MSATSFACPICSFSYCESTHFCRIADLVTVSSSNSSLKGFVRVNARVELVITTFKSLDWLSIYSVLSNFHFFHFLFCKIELLIFQVWWGILCSTMAIRKVNKFYWSNVTWGVVNFYWNEFFVFPVSQFIQLNFWTILLYNHSFPDSYSNFSSNSFNYLYWGGYPMCQPVFYNFFLLSVNKIIFRQNEYKFRMEIFGRT